MTGGAAASTDSEVISTRELLIDETPYTSPTGVEGFMNTSLLRLAADGTVEAGRVDARLHATQASGTSPTP